MDAIRERGRRRQVVDGCLGGVVEGRVVRGAGEAARADRVPWWSARRSNSLWAVAVAGGSFWGRWITAFHWTAFRSRRSCLENGRLSLSPVGGLPVSARILRVGDVCRLIGDLEEGNDQRPRGGGEQGDEGADPRRFRDPPELVPASPPGPARETGGAQRPAVEVGPWCSSGVVLQPEDQPPESEPGRDGREGEREPQRPPAEPARLGVVEAVGDQVPARQPGRLVGPDEDDARRASVCSAALAPCVISFLSPARTTRPRPRLTKQIWARCADRVRRLSPIARVPGYTCFLTPLSNGPLSSPIFTRSVPGGLWTPVATTRTRFALAGTRTSA